MVENFLHTMQTFSPTLEIRELEFVITFATILLN